MPRARLGPYVSLSPKKILQRSQSSPFWWPSFPFQPLFILKPLLPPLQCPPHRSPRARYKTQDGHVRGCGRSSVQIRPRPWRHGPWRTCSCGARVASDLRLETGPPGSRSPFHLYPLRWCCRDKPSRSRSAAGGALPLLPIEKIQITLLLHRESTTGHTPLSWY